MSQEIRRSIQSFSKEVELQERELAKLEARQKRAMHQQERFNDSVNEARTAMLAAGDAYRLMNDEMSRVELYKMTAEFDRFNDRLKASRKHARELSWEIKGLRDSLSKLSGLPGAASTFSVLMSGGNYNGIQPAYSSGRASGTKSNDIFSAFETGYGIGKKIFEGAGGSFKESTDLGLLALIPGLFNSVMTAFDKTTGERHMLETFPKVARLQYEMVGKELADDLSNGISLAVAQLQSDSDQTAFNRLTMLSDFETQRQLAMGNGYMDERLNGYISEDGKRVKISDAEGAFYSSDAGKTMIAAQEYLGRYEAEQENARRQGEMKGFEQYADAIQAAIDSKNSDEVSRLYRLAMNAGDINYRLSDDYENYEENEIALLNKIGSSLSQTWQRFGDNFEQAVGKLNTLTAYYGHVKDTVAANLRKNPMPIPIDDGSLNGDVYSGPGQPATSNGWNFNAVGLPYVPYDRYPAVLHEGERVMTASDNRRYSKGGGGSVNITGNQFNIREEADVYRVAAELARQLGIALAVS